MIPNYRNKSKTECIDCVVVPGRIPFSTANVYSTLAVTPGGGSAVTFTSTTAGTAGDAYHVVMTADGNQKAYIACATAGCTNLNTVIQVKTGGTAGNSWKLNVMAHGHTGAGVLINEDNTNKVATILFETAVSTVSDVETALGGTTYIEVKTTGTGTNILAAATDTLHSSSFAGGTAATWAAWTAGTNTLTVHFTDTTSTTTLIQAAVAGLTGALITCTGGTGTNTWATGDAFASTHLAGGVDAVALDTTAVVGEGFTATRTGAAGDGTVTITFTKAYKEMHAAQYGLQLNSVANTILELGTYNQSAGTIKITPRTLAGTTVEPAPGANNKIHFCFIMRQ